MKNYIVAISIFITASGCAVNGNPNSGARGFFDPEIAASTERTVSIHDPLGAPGKAQELADRHCKQWNRYAVFARHGGDGMLCLGRSPCVTYHCVQ